MTGAPVDLTTTTPEVLEQAATMLHTEFDGPTGWPSADEARATVSAALAAGLAFGVLDGAALVGWIGGLVEYDGNVVELHPLVVRREWRRRGVGTSLVGALEAEARRRGAATVTLGTDVDTGMTTLAAVDLYDDLPRHLAGLADLGGGHPFLFYRALGYTVTGVVPDANGRGRPDILMAKRL